MRQTPDLSLIFSVTENEILNLKNVIIGILNLKNVIKGIFVPHDLPVWLTRDDIFSTWKQ